MSAYTEPAPATYETDIKLSMSQKSKKSLHAFLLNGIKKDTCQSNKYPRTTLTAAT